MAAIGKPNKVNRKGTPPALEDPVVKNLEKPASTGRAQLKFDVPPEFKKEYKTFALDNDLTMVQLLMESFELFKKNR